MNKSLKIRSFVLIWLISLVFPLTAFASECLKYDRTAAVNYAKKYWGPGKNKYNWIGNDPPGQYYAYDNDCTNFVSQALTDGGFAGKFNKDMCTGFGIPCRWDLILRGECSGCVDEKGMIVRIDVLVAILQRYFCAEVSVMGKSTVVPSNLKKGDVIVFGLLDEDGDVASERFHAGIIVETDGTFETTKKIF